MAQSSALTAFYNAYNDWLEAGAPVRQSSKSSFKFQRDLGLCTSLRRWAIHNEYVYGLAIYDIADEMVMQFQAEHLHDYFPFGATAFEYDMNNETMHTCPCRIAWVKSHLSA